MCAQPRPVEEIVAENQCALLTVEELLAQDQRFGESVGLVLYDVGDLHAQLRPVAEQAEERVLIVGGRDEKNFTKATEHQSTKWIKNHGLVVDGQQLFGHRSGDGMQARTGAASQNDSLHPISIEVSYPLS